MKVKVITKIFNEEDFLDTFLTYYLAQHVDEVIVYDDGSTDASPRNAKRYERIQVRTFPEPFRVYDQVSDESRCQHLLEVALAETSEPTWWIFVDADEFLRPDSTVSQETPLADHLRTLKHADAIAAVGLHCLPYVPEDARFSEAPTELLKVLPDLAPPRSFEPSHATGESWKLPALRIAPETRDRLESLRFSSGGHLLLGDTSDLLYHSPLWTIRHYKVRRVSRFLERTRQVLGRVPRGHFYREIIQGSLDRVDSWSRSRFRILRVAPVLTEQAISLACRETTPPSVYYESPFHPGRWRGGTQ